MGNGERIAQLIKDMGVLESLLELPYAHLARIAGMSILLHPFLEI